MSTIVGKFNKIRDSLTNGNPVKPNGNLENSLALFWFEQGKFAREEELVLHIAESISKTIDTLNGR